MFTELIEKLNRCWCNGVIGVNHDKRSSESCRCMYNITDVNNKKIWPKVRGKNHPPQKGLLDNLLTLINLANVDL